MPKFPHNIEARKSPFGDHRTAYACGIVWRVTGRNGDWSARPAPVNRAASDRQRAMADRVPTLRAPTLMGLGEKLSTLNQITERA